MTKVTFKRFLEIGNGRDAFGETPEADFARDALRDKNFRDFTTAQELEDYVLFHSRGDVEVAEAAKNLFKKWKAAQ